MTAKLKGGCPVDEQLNLTAVVDGAILEVYTNDRFAITTALWPTESISPESREVGLVVARGAREGDGRRRDGDGDGGGGEAEAYSAAVGAGQVAQSTLFNMEAADGGRAAPTEAVRLTLCQCLQ